MQKRGFVSLPLNLFENRHLLTLSVLMILIGGYSAFVSMPRIEDPRITDRYPRIVTLMPGSSAVRIEALVTDPLESGLQELAEIKEMYSSSRAGGSYIRLELQDHITRDEIQQVFSKIRDRLDDLARNLPKGVIGPRFEEKRSAIAFSVVAAISWGAASSPNFTVMDRLATDLADRMRQISGTDTVRIFGAPGEELSVVVDDGELASLGLTAALVAKTIAKSDVNAPAGVLRGESRDLLIEVDGELDTVELVKRIPLQDSSDNRVVTVGDVANVRKTWVDPPIDMAYQNGVRSILVAMQTRRDVRVDRWATNVRNALARFSAEVPANVTIDLVFDQSSYTASRLTSLGGNLVAGALLITIIVFVGMGWRASIVVACALPLSAALSVFGMSFLGQQIHQMSIFGMIVATGLLIDNAIVMTDAVKRNLDKRLDRRLAVQEAVARLFMPLLASTLTTVLGFMPVFLLPGAIGDFTGPIAIAVVLALSASLLLALTVIPVVAGIYLQNRNSAASRPWWIDGVNFDSISVKYHKLLTFLISRPRVTVSACLVAPAIGFFLAGSLGHQFFPPADRDQFEIEVWMPASTSIKKTAAFVRRIEYAIRQYGEVDQVHWLIGGSFPSIYYNRLMKEDANSAYAHAMVYTDSADGAKTLTTILPGVLTDQFPGAQVIVSPFAQGPAVEAPVAFRIRGPDTKMLTSLGNEARRIMQKVPSIIQTRASLVGGQPELSYTSDEIIATRLNLSRTDIAEQLQAGFEGQIGGTMFDGAEELPVRVRSSNRNSEKAISSYYLTARTEGSPSIPIESVGQYSLVPRIAAIGRFNGVRTNDIFAYIDRDALAIDVSKNVLVALEAEGFSMPFGYSITAAGDSAEQSEAVGSLATYLPVLILLMVGTVILSFRSVWIALHIWTVGVLSAGLGLLSLWAGGYAIGFNAIVGSIGLFGVAINGTIVVLAALIANDKARSGDIEAIVLETIGATRHILLTVLTTIGGFMPLLIFSGGEFWPPLAIVMSGGIGLSVTLSLAMTPALFYWRCNLHGILPPPKTLRAY